MSGIDFGPALARIDQLLPAAFSTIWISALGLAAALCVGFVVAVGGAFGPPLARFVARLFVDVVRGTPLLVQIFLLFFLPASFGLRLPVVVTGVVALGIYFGAYVSEIIRGGLDAVPKGHEDAGRSLGMSTGAIAWRIVLPQAFAIIVPPLTSQATTLVKASSLLSAVGMQELTHRGAFITVATLRPLETWTAIAVIYLALNSVIIIVARLLERRLRRFMPQPA